MIKDINLVRIISTYVSVEEYNTEDNYLNTIDVNTWIHYEENKFYIGVPEIIGNGKKDKTFMVSNINIVKPYKDKYLVVRNYYLFNYKDDFGGATILRGKYIDKNIENCIINSAKFGHLKTILKGIYDNCNVYFEEEEINDEEKI